MQLRPQFSNSIAIALCALVLGSCSGTGNVTPRNARFDQRNHSLSLAGAVQQGSTGSYVFSPTPICGGCQPGGGRNRYEAHGSGGLLATGSFDFTDLVFVTGTEVTGTIDCLTVSGNEAVLHGVVSSSTPASLYAPGSSVVWRVISNRGNAPDDSSIPQPGSVACCIGGFNACNPPLFPTADGNINVMS